MLRRGAIARACALIALIALAACDDGNAPAAAPAPSASPAPPSAIASTDAAPTPASTIAPPFSLTAPIPLSPRAAASLAADLARRTALAKDSPEHPSRLQPVAGTFLVIAGDRGAPIDAAIALTQRVFDALYVNVTPPKTSPLSHFPDKAVEVWVYSNARSFAQGLDLHTFLRDEPPGLGIYESQSRAIVVRTDAAGTGTLAHEIAHPLVQQDAPLAPTWLQEAIPAVFELVDLSTPGEIHGKPHFRLQTLRDTLASHDEVAKGALRLDALFRWTSWAFYNSEGLSLRYAVARESARWLDSMGKLWPFWHACRDGILEDPTCEAAFTKIVGASPAEATAQWLAWIASPEAG